jgi:acetylornithine deacetylase
MHVDVEGHLGEVRRRVARAVEDRFPETVAFAQKLVSFPSVNPVFSSWRPRGEKDLQEYLAQYLVSVGFDSPDLWEPDPLLLERKYSGLPGFVPGRCFQDRPDLVARLPGAGGGRSILLAGHIDVVGADPKREAWVFDPFSGTVHEGRLYGRGANDMKGGIAAMIQAVLALGDAGIRLQGDVLVATVVDEETGGMGTLSLLDRGYRADAAIFSEPSGLRPVTLCRGILWGRIHVRGRAGHIEISQPGFDQGGAVDAVEKGRRVLDLIDRLNHDWSRQPKKRHPLLPSACRVNVSMIEAGQHPSSFAENCVITVDVQYLPGERDERGLGGRVKSEVETHLRDGTRDDPWLRENPPTIDWFVDVDPAELDPDDGIALVLRGALRDLGLDPTPDGTEAHSDHSLLANHGIPALDFGPGSPFLAHQTNEYVELDELKKATVAFAFTLMDWCGVETGPGGRGEPSSGTREERMTKQESTAQGSDIIRGSGNGFRGGSDGKRVP